MSLPAQPSSPGRLTGLCRVPESRAVPQRPDRGLSSSRSLSSVAAGARCSLCCCHLTPALCPCPRVCVGLGLFVCPCAPSTFLLRSSSVCFRPSWLAFSPSHPAQVSQLGSWVGWGGEQDVTVAQKAWGGLLSESPERSQHLQPVCSCPFLSGTRVGLLGLAPVFAGSLVSLGRAECGQVDEQGSGLQGPHQPLLLENVSCCTARRHLYQAPVC